MDGRHALLFVSLLLASGIPGSQSQRCESITWDTSHGPNPIAQHSGKIVLVALMKGYCQYCINQARLMQDMYERLTAEGLTDIQMIIVNGGEPGSRNLVNNFRDAVTLQVLQDSPDHYMYREAFRGLKDDAVIYDRCGQRTFFIPFPYSNLQHNITERLLRRTYAGNHFCYCSRDYARSNPYDTMYGDAPSSSSGTNNGDVNQEPINSIAERFNFINCPENDSACQRFMTIFNQIASRSNIGHQADGQGLGVFVDQSDFNLGSSGSRSLFNRDERMGQMGTGFLGGRRGRYLPANRRSHHRFQPRRVFNRNPYFN